VGITGVFPEFRTRNAKVNLLEDRINDCFERSMNGQRLPNDSEPVVALVAYMTWLSQGQPVGTSVAGRGFPKLKEQPEPDANNGRVVYASRCAACHGAEGQGISGPGGAYAFPPLWGDRSFNIGAGMARLDTATAFVSHNMPLGQGGTLSAQEAVDVASFFTAQPRPDFARKHEDWPAGGKPRDARY
jgi:thiosulfate dehydrogenase